MTSIAVLTNPSSDGNKSHLDLVRRFCAAQGNIAHFEVGDLSELDQVLDRIALSRARVLVINGGDGTVQSVLTRAFGEGAPERRLPPIAVVPSGRTNQIAKDLGSGSDPIDALQRVIAALDDGINTHLVRRQLMSLDTGDGSRPMLGMFFAAGALAETMLYCRHKIYPLRMPNWLAHFLTVVLGVVSVLTDSSSRLLPPRPREAGIRVGERRMRGRYQVLLVSTLQSLVLTCQVAPPRERTLRLMALERRRMAVLRTVVAGLTGRLGDVEIPGLHFENGDEISFDDDSAVIMDGESYAPAPGKPIVLKPAATVRFVDLSHGLRAPARVSDETPWRASGQQGLAALSPLSSSRARS